MLRRVSLLVVLPLGCGPVVETATHEEPPPECPPDDAEDLWDAPRVQVRLVNASAEPIVVEEHSGSRFQRYFDVEGIAEGRAVRGRDDPCDFRSCAVLMTNGIVDCEGIAFIGLPIFLPPGTAYETQWRVELVAEYELPAACAHDGAASTCNVVRGAAAGDYAIRSTSLRADTCDARPWTCRELDDVQAGGACTLDEPLYTHTCSVGPEATARWDGESEIVLVFDR